MKLKRLIIAVLVIIVVVLIYPPPANIYASIGSTSLTVDARRGWAFYFQKQGTVCDQTWPVLEPIFITYLEKQDLEYNADRINEDAARAQKIQFIRDHLRIATDEAINSAATALGM